MSKQKDTSVYFPTLVFEGKVRRPAVVLPSSQSRISSSLNIESAKCINTSHLSVGHINHRLLLTEAPSSCTHSRRKDQTSSTSCKLMALPAISSRQPAIKCKIWRRHAFQEKDPASPLARWQDETRKTRNPSSHMPLLFSLSIHVTEEESSGPSLH